jgi:hypothetical protein
VNGGQDQSAPFATMGTPMPIHSTLNPLLTWRLTPLKRLNSQWAFSTYRGEAYVRAASEQTARVFAAERFASGLAAVSPNSPWLSDVFTKAEVVEDERFASVTTAGVVYPER